MKRLLVASFALALMAPACVFAQSIFDGSWKLDPATVHVTGAKAHVISLKDGMYQCNCKPPINVKADGADHPVSGHPDFDAVAVKVINDHTIQLDEKKAGKIVGTSTLTAAADGKTSTLEFTDNTGTAPASGTLLADRIGKSVPGSNTVAGSWKFDHYESLSDPSTTITFKLDGSALTVGDLAGESSYTAQIGGKAVPYMDHGKADGSVSVKQLGKDTLRATHMKDGKLTSTITVTVAADGKTMRMVIHNPDTGATTTMVHNKV